MNSLNQLDILAFGAHPDDVEAACGGILAKHALAGYKTGIVDLTRGEMGSRGSPEERDKESAQAAKVLGLKVRENLEMTDAFIFINEESLLSVIKTIRKFKPRIVLINPLHDRHPDHEKAGELVKQAAFLAGLSKIETIFNNEKQAAWKPKAVYQYMLSRLHIPSFVIPLTDQDMELKLEALRCYGTQFCGKDSALLEANSMKGEGFGQYEKEDLKPLFASLILGRAREFAQPLERLEEYKYAEGLLACRTPGINDLLAMV